MKNNEFLRWFAPGVVLLGFLFAVYYQIRQTGEMVTVNTAAVKEVTEQVVDAKEDAAVVSANVQTTAEILSQVVLQQQWLTAEIFRQQKEQGVILGTMEAYRDRLRNLEEEDE